MNLDSLHGPRLSTPSQDPFLGLSSEFRAPNPKLAWGSVVWKVDLISHLGSDCGASEFRT